MQKFISKPIILTLMAIATSLHASMPSNPDMNQLENFRERVQEPIGIMTTSAGAPIPYSEAVSTLDTRLIFNEYFMDSITHGLRERLPERIVHPKGTGGFGYFIVTHNISAICRAKLFSEDGKKTPIAVRFSITLTERGGSDTSRDGRGFAVKFYTEEGNLDIVANNVPVFGLKDPVLFPSFVRAFIRNPATDLYDPNMLWDFVTLRPETLHFLLYLFSDQGIPDGYRHMPGYSINTYQVENEQGDINFVRFHFIPNAGIRTLTSEQARKIQEFEFDYDARDLYRAIGTGNFPVWNVSIQIVTLEHIKNVGYSVFDVTRILPIDEYPLNPIGKLVLNRNPLNNFAEIEQLAMNPANLIDGVLGAPDTIFQARRLTYREAQSYRLGSNYNRINVNCPFQSKLLDYNRDGRPPLGDNEGDIPNYFPNSFNGPIPQNDNHRTPLIKIIEDKADNFDQVRNLYLTMSAAERRRLIENILNSIRPVVRFLQERAVKMFTIIHPDLGNRIEQGLFGNCTNK